MKKNKLFQNLLMTLFLSFFLLPIFLCPVNAKDEEGTQKEGVINEYVRKTSKIGMNNAKHVNQNVNNIMKEFIVQIGGATGNEISQAKLGAIQNIAFLIDTISANPPASGISYLAHVGEKLNIASPAYAQGIGFSGLRPLLPLWRASRNIAYIFFTLIFVAVGLAIMFRVKISPQVTVTFQSALPKLVITLILITFSYAIVGFVIDLIYVIPSLVYYALPDTITGSLNHSVEEYYNSRAGMVWANVSKRTWGTAGNIAKNVPLLTIGGGIIAVAGVIGWIVSAVGAAGAAGAGAVVLLVLIILTLILITFLRIVFMLIKSYVKIILLTVAAPLQIMISAIPGQNTFKSWFMNLIKNVLVFPVTIILFILAAIFATTAFDGTWVPPLLGWWGGKAQGVAGAVLSLGIILIIPNIDQVIAGLFAGKPFDYGSAVGQAMGAPGRGMLTLANWGETAARSMGKEGWLRPVGKGAASGLRKLRDRGKENLKKIIGEGSNGPTNVPEGGEGPPTSRP